MECKLFLPQFEWLRGNEVLGKVNILTLCIPMEIFCLTPWLGVAESCDIFLSHSGGLQVGKSV